MGKEEQDLVIGVGVTRGGQVQAAYSHLVADEFRAWLSDVARAVPAHYTWFAKCWDQVLVEVLVHGDLAFVLVAYECVGRAQAKAMLAKLRDELAPALLGSQVGKAEKRLKALACSLKGVVPSRKVLVLYEGAPKKFLTKEDQAPEYLEAGGKSRLQKALEAADSDDDAFTFSVNGARSRAEDDEDEDQFTFNFPPKAGGAGGQDNGEGGQKPNGLIFTSHFVPGAGGAGASARPLAKSLSKKFPSPGRSGDFTWNGARVSPDDTELLRKNAQGGHKPLSNAFHSTIHAFRGKPLFSGQFEKDGGGRQADSKVKGAVGSIAPSGLSWEDEIASQLAAAGVRVSSADDPGADADADEPKGGGDLKSPASSARRFPLPSLSRGGSVHHTMLFAGPTGSQLRAGSMGRAPERGLGLGRLAKGLRKTFKPTAEDVSS